MISALALTVLPTAPLAEAGALLPGVVGPGALLASYTFRMMLLGTSIVGLTAGVLGAFLYLHKQSLVSDIIGHAATLGVAGSFIIATAVLGIGGRSMLVLTIGSIIASTCAVLLANWIAARSPVGLDAAMTICLALFYGGGIVLMRIIVHSSLPERGGITSYMFGNAATLTRADLVTIVAFGAASLIVVAVCWKELALLTFDPIACRAMGFSPRVLSPLLLGTATVAIVIGIKAVGLILMVAFAIMPAAAARQWTHHLWSMVGLSGLIGGASGAIGSALAVNLGRVPTGPVVVLVLSILLVASLLGAPERSILRRRARLRAQRRELLSRITAEAHRAEGAGTAAPGPAAAVPATAGPTAGGATMREGAH